MEKYDVKYSCGCVHEIMDKQGVHEPTGKNNDCEYHKAQEKTPE